MANVLESDCESDHLDYNEVLQDSLDDIDSQQRSNPAPPNDGKPSHSHCTYANVTGGPFIPVMIPKAKINSNGRRIACTSSTQSFDRTKQSM